MSCATYLVLSKTFPDRVNKNFKNRVNRNFNFFGISLVSQGLVRPCLTLCNGFMSIKSISWIGKKLYY